MAGMKLAMMHWGKLVGLTVFLSLSVSSLAIGSLGESTATVEQDRLMLNGTVHVESHAGFSVHVVEAQGSSVREYVSSAGVVFGLVWKHQTGPLNLEQLFGSYYEDYSRAAVAQPRPSQKFLRIETERLIVERGGRMGATWGRVWIPSLLPSGFLKDHLQ